MENICENCIATNMCKDVMGSREETMNYANFIYNKAIDDLRNELKNHYTEYNIDLVLEDTNYYSYTTACNYLEDYIDEIAAKVKKMSDRRTNADRIRNMSDAELAMFIGNLADCTSCDLQCPGITTTIDECCRKHLEWLQSEAE